MNISAKVEYACIAVLELAARYETGEPVRIRDIADKHGIPSRFLVQILLQLKSAGIVASTRGAAGGYRMSKDPANTTLCEVMGVVEGRPEQIASNTTETPMSRVLINEWNRVCEVEREMLADLTFADLVAKADEVVEQMYYI